MTKDEFITKKHVSPWQLESWLSKGWIRGAITLDDGTVYIPSGAIKPYSRRKSKEGVGLYTSIIKGVSQGLDVFPELYGIHPERFRFFIEQLKKMEYIDEIEIDSIVYYVPLEKCVLCEGLSSTEIGRRVKQSLEVLSPVVRAASEGAVAGLKS